MKFLKNKPSHAKGFTLVELLVVIAVLAVLAAIILLAVNPAEQLARGRDSARVSAVTQLGRTLQAYYTAQNAQYPPVGTDWMQPMVVTTDLKTKVGNVVYAAGAPSGGAAETCVAGLTQTVGVVNGSGPHGYCYNTALVGGVPEAVVYVRLEAALNNNRCPGSTPPNTAWYVFSSANGRAGVVCHTGAPPLPGTVTFVGNP